MANVIHVAMRNAAYFRADRGELDRAEALFKKGIHMADFSGTADDKFFARIHFAQFLADNGRDAEAEAIYKSAIDPIPMSQFNLRHSLAIRELGELVVKQGRKAEGMALQTLAAAVFDSLADDVCMRAIDMTEHRAC